MVKLNKPVCWSVLATLILAGVIIPITNDTHVQWYIVLESADVLKFGRGSVLLSNNACSVKVVALEINHTQVTPDGAAPALVESIDVELAAMHGTTQRHSVTDDMVVSPLSQKHDTNPGVSPA
ncbi:MAG: hypothetical protein AAF787_17925 [Chloroflexota bacterium]